MLRSHDSQSAEFECLLVCCINCIKCFENTNCSKFGMDRIHVGSAANSLFYFCFIPYTTCYLVYRESSQRKRLTKFSRRIVIGQGCSFSSQNFCRLFSEGRRFSQNSNIYSRMLNLHLWINPLNVFRTVSIKMKSFNRQPEMKSNGFVICFFEPLGKDRKRHYALTQNRNVLKRCWRPEHCPHSTRGISRRSPRPPIQAVGSNGVSFFTPPIKAISVLSNQHFNHHVSLF